MVESKSNASPGESTEPESPLLKHEFRKGNECEFDCPVCFEIVAEPVRSPCDHLFCRGCYKKVLSGTYLACPLCRAKFDKKCIPKVDRSL